MPYVRKTSDIHISDEMHRVLRQMEDNSEVARLLLRQRHPVESLVEDHVDYISISKSDKTKISYLPQDRMDKVDGEYWHTSKRFNVKPGAFVSKVFVNIPEKEVEKFATLFKNIQNAPDFTFKVVEGSDILKYYHYNSYADQSSSLGASCMKHPSCQEFLNIYVDNSDKVKMLVMLNRDSNLIGRALLWNTEPKVMDRIYTIHDDEYSYHFKKWADDNEYMYKREQKWNNTLFFESKGKSTMMEMSVTLDNVDYRRYPYFDTFKFINLENKTLYNYIPSDVSVRTLSTPDGSNQPSDFLARDGKTNLFHHFHDTIFVDHVGYRTLANNTYYSEVNDQHIMKDDAKFDDDLNDYIFSDDSKNNHERIKERMDYIRKRKEEREKMTQTTKRNSISSMFDRYFMSSDIESIISDYEVATGQSIGRMWRNEPPSEAPSESESTVEV
jgi:hypothetical protein